MRRRCLQQGMTQHLFLVLAGLLLLTLYHNTPPVVPRRSPAPISTPVPSPVDSPEKPESFPEIPESFPQTSDPNPEVKVTEVTNGGKETFIGGFESAGEFPISLESDTGADSVVSQFMMAVDLIKKTLGQKVGAKESKKDNASEGKGREIKEDIKNTDKNTKPSKETDSITNETLRSKESKDSNTSQTLHPKNKGRESNTESPNPKNITNPETNQNANPKSNNMHSNTNQTANRNTFKESNTTTRPDAMRTGPNTGNTTMASLNPAPPNTLNHTCNMSVRPLSTCNCTRKIRTHGLPTCSLMARETNTEELLAALNRTLGSSTCGVDATLRGANQKVLSTSVYGPFPNEYHGGLSEVVKRAGEAYPGWTVRVYHDLDLEEPSKREWACKLACKYPFLDFCSVKSLPGIGDISSTIGTVWRLGVLGDPLVERFIVRDADSPILQREVDAVNDWISSGKCFHLMRDNPFHTMPIMGGMFGGCGFWHRKVLERVRGTIFRFSGRRSHTKDYDQINEGRFLWPTIKKNFISHDSYFCQHFLGSRPFPTQRVNRTFVGMRMYREEFRKDMIHKPCPVACRPPQHKDWEFC